MTPHRPLYNPGNGSPSGRFSGPRKDFLFWEGEQCPPRWVPAVWAKYRRQIISMALTATAGFIDAVGYMILLHIYTANMSGNSITFGTEAAYHRSSAAFHAILPVACFIVGLCLCTFLLELLDRFHWRIRLAVVLGLEWLCLAAFFVLGVIALGWHYPGRLPDLSVFSFLTVLAAGAMGLQNASLTHVGSLTVTTTHVTGTLLKFAEGLMHYLFWLYDHTIGRFPRRWRVTLRLSPRRRSCRQAFLMGSLWICYVVGAFIGAMWLAKGGLSALIGPLCMVGLFVLLDLFWPAACSSGFRQKAIAVVSTSRKRL